MSADVTVLSDDVVKTFVLRCLDKPVRLTELRALLKQRYSIPVSYTRLKRIVRQLEEENKITCFAYGRSILCTKK